MVSIRRPGTLKPWRRGEEKEDIYFLMIRVDDWRLMKKSAAIRLLESDPYTIPPFHHITLYGPFSLKEGSTPDDLYGAIESACKGLFSLDCRLSGWIRLRGRKGEAIAHEVRPADNFSLFYHRLWQQLGGIAQSRSWIDQDPLKRRFHITHTYNLNVRNAGIICQKVREAVRVNRISGNTEYTGTGENKIISHPVADPELLPEFGPLTLLRVALLKNGALRGEFDIPSGEWLSRALAYNPQRSIISLKQYRRLSGIELISPPDAGEKPPFVVSDLHLGHGNSIRYCRRPFSYASEMDEVLTHNWNLTVGMADEVIYLGDLRYGPYAAPAADYLSHLNGRITFVQGNHDDKTANNIPFLRLSQGGEDFLCIHNPDDAPADFKGWVIHGHHHNNNLKDYPFIDFVHRRINASIELTGYRPVSLDKVLSFIKNLENIERLETMPLSVPVKQQNTKNTGN